MARMKVASSSVPSARSPGNDTTAVATATTRHEPQRDHTLDGDIGGASYEHDHGEWWIALRVRPGPDRVSCRSS
jgi:hypothetical protein